MKAIKASLSFERCLKDYHQAKPEGLLIYQEESWKIVNINDLKAQPQQLSLFLLESAKKVLSLEASNLNPEHLTYWLNRFNSTLTSLELKAKKIIAIPEATKNVQFNSCNAYAWLSNFFTSLIYDSTHKVIYPSVECGYVAFKARKINKSAQEILSFAHNLNAKDVKQQGRDLWKRNSKKDDLEAIIEMKRLVSLKFKQNVTLSILLKKSAGASIEEFTSDPFWGTANGAVYTADSNQLGKIIEQVRTEL